LLFYSNSGYANAPQCYVYTCFACFVIFPTVSQFVVHSPIRFCTSSKASLNTQRYKICISLFYSLIPQLLFSSFTVLTSPKKPTARHAVSTDGNGKKFNKDSRCPNKMDPVISRIQVRSVSRDYSYKTTVAQFKQFPSFSAPCSFITLFTKYHRWPYPESSLAVYYPVPCVFIRSELTFKDEAYLFYIRTQCLPRCKHSPLRL
jgi:hypothetical protein